MVGKAKKSTYEDLEIKIQRLETETQKLRDTERTLRESEERFRSLSEIAEDGIMVTENGIIVDGNKALECLFGYELSELIGMEAIKLVSPEFHELIWKYRGTNIPIELSGIRKDGSIFHCRSIGKPYTFKGKSLRVSAVTNIIEFKLAEEALKRQTMALHKRVKELNCLLSISKMIQKGQMTQEGIIQGVINLIPPSFHNPENICARFKTEDREYTTNNFERTSRCEFCDVKFHGKKIGSLEIFHHKDGDDSDGWPFQREEKRLINAIAERLGRIIELKQAQMDLMESEKTYRRVFENSGAPAIIIEKDTTIRMANPEFENMTGYSRTELENKKKWLDFFRGTDRDVMLLCLQDSQRRGRSTLSTEHECELYTRKGTTKVVAYKIGTIPGPQQRSIVSLVDITDRKKAMDSLLSSEEYLRRENQRLKSSIKGRYRFGGLIGQGPAMQEVYNLILEAASATANIIVYGESGTGKELVARAIHDMSDRCNKEFVPINCGAIAESILESELFGYKKGAFTGAGSDKAGLLDRADGGTLFMDEIGDIGLNMQVKLLRAIEGGGYMPVGSSNVKKSDFRIIAATNKDLRVLMEKNRMREDFYYRIHIIPIHLPPLRDRKEDIPLLVNYFMKQYCEGKEIPPITAEVLDMLNNYEWPGNVRELQNVLHRFVTLRRIDLIGIPRSKANVPQIYIGGNPPDQSWKTALRDTLDDYEREHIVKVLEMNKWKKGISALALGINRRTLYEKMRKHGLTEAQNGVK